MTDPIDLTPYTLANLREEMNQRFDAMEARQQANTLAILEHLGMLAGAMSLIAKRMESLEARMDRLESRLPADA